MSRTDEDRDAEIVVVGAGAAGVGAARALAARGRRVLVVEAGPRVGGRAHTAEAAGLALDLGCGWLHSGERNSWTGIAESSGFAVSRGETAWGRQFRGLGFSPDEQAAARGAFARWNDRLYDAPPTSDVAAEALEPAEPWTPFLQAMSGYISGAPLEEISVADYAAYDEASSHNNWRVARGYGTLVAASLPPAAALRLATPVEGIALDGRGVALATPAGTIRARAAILTVSTTVLARDAIRLPPALDPWREAARQLPLGCNEKLFLEIVGDDHPFEPETHVIGNPRDAATASHYIRPFGHPVIECFLGGAGAAMAAEEGQAAGFAAALDALAALFGSGVRRSLRPLAASNWTRATRIGGAYSHALPGCAAARQRLASAFEDRLFFAGEATHRSDFSTAHGAHDSGVRAALEADAALGPAATGFWPATAG